MTSLSLYQVFKIKWIAQPMNKAKTACQKCCFFFKGNLPVSKTFNLKVLCDAEDTILENTVA